MGEGGPNRAAIQRFPFPSITMISVRFEDFGDKLINQDIEGLNVTNDLISTKPNVFHTYHRKKVGSDECP